MIRKESLRAVKRNVFILTVEPRPSTIENKAPIVQSRALTQHSWMQTGQGLRALCHIVGKEFERNEAAEFSILGLVHNSHPASTEFLGDAVMRDGLADHSTSLRPELPRDNARNSRDLRDGDSVGARRFLQFLIIAIILFAVCEGKLSQCLIQGITFPHISGDLCGVPRLCVGQG